MILYRFVTTSKPLEVVTKRAFLAKNDARRRDVSKYDARAMHPPKDDAEFVTNWGRFLYTRDIFGIIAPSFRVAMQLVAQEDKTGTNSDYSSAQGGEVHDETKWGLWYHVY